MTFKLTTTARKLKVALVIDAAPFATLRIGDNAPARTEVTVTVGGRTVSADLATKSVRKVIKTLTDHGTDNVVLILQGALSASDRIEDAGITAQVKAPQPVAA
jgi:hypothetical protein